MQAEINSNKIKNVKEVNNMNARRHADKLAYFFIAFAIYLIIRAIAASHSASPINILLYISIATSLLASNIPRVLDIPLHFAYPVRCIEIFTFGIAVVCFIVMCMRHIWA